MQLHRACTQKRPPLAECCREILNNWGDLHLWKGGKEVGLDREKLSFNALFSRGLSQPHRELWSQDNPLWLGRVGAGRPGLFTPVLGVGYGLPQKGGMILGEAALFSCAISGKTMTGEGLCLQTLPTAEGHILHF